MPASQRPPPLNGLKSSKGVLWTEDEHTLFLAGLEKHGKGDWRSISRHFVRTRTPTQVASHAQKYFMRLQGGAKPGQLGAGVGAPFARRQSCFAILAVRSDGGAEEDGGFAAGDGSDAGDDDEEGEEFAPSDLDEEGGAAKRRKLAPADEADPAAKPPGGLEQLMRAARAGGVGRPGAGADNESDADEAGVQPTTPGGAGSAGPANSGTSSFTAGSQNNQQMRPSGHPDSMLGPQCNGGPSAGASNEAQPHAGAAHGRGSVQHYAQTPKGVFALPPRLILATAVATANTHATSGHHHHNQQQQQQHAGGAQQQQQHGSYGGHHGGGNGTSSSEVAAYHAAAGRYGGSYAPQQQQPHAGQYGGGYGGSQPAHNGAGGQVAAAFWAHAASRHYGGVHPAFAAAAAAVANITASGRDGAQPAAIGGATMVHRPTALRHTVAGERSAFSAFCDGALKGAGPTSSSGVASAAPLPAGAPAMTSPAGASVPASPEGSEGCASDAVAPAGPRTAAAGGAARKAQQHGEEAGVTDSR